jgi:hypothetical protein
MATVRNFKDSERVRVYFGKLTHKVNGKNVSQHTTIWPTLRAQKALNLPRSSAAHEVGVKIKNSSKYSELKGFKGSQSIDIKHPTKKKEKGKGWPTITIPVPSYASIADIRKFLSGTKAKEFRVDGKWKTVK